jgi:hypothetical protein
MVIPDASNGRRCCCGRPVYLTPDGWRALASNASHPEPQPRARGWQPHAGDNPTC